VIFSAREITKGLGVIYSGAAGFFGKNNLIKPARGAVLHIALFFGGSPAITLSRDYFPENKYGGVI